MMMTKNLLNLVSWQAQSRQGTGQRGLLCSQKVQDGPSQTGRFFFFSPPACLTDLLFE